MRIPIVLSDTSVLIDVVPYAVCCPTYGTGSTEFRHKEARRRKNLYLDPVDTFYFISCRDISHRYSSSGQIP